VHWKKGWVKITEYRITLCVGQRPSNKTLQVLAPQLSLRNHDVGN